MRYSYMEDVNIEQQVISFLSDISSIEKNKISLNSNIAEELKLEGDDAVEMLEEFGRKFEVDMTSISVDDFFVSEASFSPIDFLWALISKRKKVIKPMYVSDLIAAAASKKWNC